MKATSLFLTLCGLLSACSPDKPKPALPPETPASPLRLGGRLVGKSFLGLTEAQLIQRLGQPIEVHNGSSPDGAYKQLIFDRTKGHETFFMVFESDGVASSGYYNGKMYP